MANVPLIRIGELSSIPPNILDGGIRALHKYLIEFGKSSKHRRTKLLIVGFAGAGKTTLLNALQPVNADLERGLFSRNKLRAVTHGTWLKIVDNDDGVVKAAYSLDKSWSLAKGTTSSSTTIRIEPRNKKQGH